MPRLSLRESLDFHHPLRRGSSPGLAGVDTWELFTGALFVVASAFCAGTETALTALGDTRARQLYQGADRRGRSLALWIESPERVLSLLLIGNTLVNIGAGTLAGRVAGELADAHGWPAPTLLAVATALATVVILFLGEIIPKTFAKRHSVRVALAAMPLVRLLHWPLRPVTAGLLWVTNAVVARLGGARAPTPSVTSEEIEYLITMGARERVLGKVEEELLHGVLEFADRVVRDVMVPRTRMVALDREAAPGEILRIVTENGYSRMPVYRGSMDEIVGVLLVRDLIPELAASPTGEVAGIERRMKPPFFVPEAMKISRLLREMQRRKTHLAVVVDEFGGTSGLVTLEDVIEEMVGEIQDEGDAEAAQVRLLSPGVWQAEASVPLRELEETLEATDVAAAVAGDPSAAPHRETKVRFPEDGDYATLGGFVTAVAGRVPAVGTCIAWEGWDFVIRAGDERRVTRVEIERRRAEPASSSSERREERASEVGSFAPPARAGGA